MYSTCLYCHADLGANEVVEHFSVGRRLAFDLANGRLWVICAQCKRWNLSPVEERWEAIEECERLFEGTRLRMSTDNIGLARVAEGTELVRVGAAMRPELAAWRFGAQLAARRRKYRLLVAGGLAATAGLYIGAKTAGFGIIAGNWAWNLVKRGYERATRLALPIPEHSTEDPDDPKVRSLFGVRLPRRDESPERTEGVRIARVESKHARGGQVVWASERSGLLLNVPIVGGARASYQGDDVPRVLSKLLTKVNRSGGSREDEQMAVQMLERVADRGSPFLPQAVLETYAGKMLRAESWKDEGNLGGLAAPTRIAIEMALQEQRERELLAGELLDLEAAWREAEELARITDTLTPSSIDLALARLKLRLQG
ncbi:MAG: hypothetical protein HYV19_07105 [Gemmatimonadetes bacterium]|nr:hypothetical protein [Gemmatimonadota bacterium]